jgi:CRISP-associated protein Cas1
MKQLLNTLFVTKQGAYLSKTGTTVEISCKQETILRVPIHTIDSIVCFGNVLCSPFLLGMCGENNIKMSFLTKNGRFLARIQGPTGGNVLLRKALYQLTENKNSCVIIAKAFVLAKIANSRVVLQRSLRDVVGTMGKRHAATEQAILDMKRYMDKLKNETNEDVIRGLEGIAANAYFGCFDSLIKADKESFYFTKRTRRPPLDNVNALLSFLYTLLVHDVSSALEGVGLDPSVGFLHKDRSGRPSLALDMMEEFRGYLVDRLVLSLINRKQIKSTGFITTESGAVTMDEQTRKIVLVAWQKRKREEIEHPFLHEKVALGLLPHVQAMLFSRFLRGDLDGYPPFLWR